MRTRVLSVAVLVVAVAVVVYLVTASGTTYTIHAHFEDAGQLVKGDDVEVGGSAVGSVSRIGLTRNGQADVVLSLSEDRVLPLHQGTFAAIRSAGLAGVANRFVDVTPGPQSAPEIADGGILPTTNTRGIVDLDMLLDAVNPPTRHRLQGIIRYTALALSPPSGRQFNRALRELSPTLAELNDLGGQLVSDQRALEGVIANGARVSSTLAARRSDLEGSVTDTAATLRAIASRRGALAETLVRAPGTLRHADRTLRDLRTTLTVVNPVVFDLGRAAPAGADLLRTLLPVTANARPFIDSVATLLPRARGALEPLPAVSARAVPGLRSTTRAVRKALPLLVGLRPYAPDLVAGFFNGFGGSADASYDANGHYMRVALEGGSTGLTGILSVLGQKLDVGPGGPNGAPTRTGLLARCPGGAVEPAPDHTNPFDQPSSCNPADNHR